MGAGFANVLLCPSGTYEVLIVTGRKLPLLRLLRPAGSELWIGWMGHLWGEPKFDGCRAELKPFLLTQ